MVLCAKCGLMLRGGEPHEEEFCRAVELARQVAKCGEFTGEVFVVDRKLFEEFRESWSGLTNATPEELLAGMRPDAWVSARVHIEVPRRGLEPNVVAVLHACGHAEEHRLKGSADACDVQREQLAGQPCFYCVYREEYLQVCAAAELRRFPQLQSEDTRREWWATLCREQVLRECERHLADLERDYSQAQAQATAASTVRPPSFAGCETREDFDAAFAEWDASLTGEEQERFEEDASTQVAIVQPYLDRVSDAEEMLHELAEVTNPDFWIARRGWSGKQVFESRRAEGFASPQH